MSKLEVLELLQSIFKYHYVCERGHEYVDYNELIRTIDEIIYYEKKKPGYFDCTLEEHQESLYG